MGFRIDKSWASVLKTTPVKRKDGEVSAADDSNKNSNQQQQQQQAKDEEEQRNYTREELEKAVSEFRANASFKSTGMEAEIIASASGLRVQLKNGTGNVVRLMTSDDFMRLHKNTKGDEKPVGSILDQKY